MRATLDAHAPNSHRVESQASADGCNAIDLSTAQSEIIRPELLEFFKTLVEDKMTDKVRARIGQRVSQTNEVTDFRSTNRRRW